MLSTQPLIELDAGEGFKEAGNTEMGKELTPSRPPLACSALILWDIVVNSIASVQAGVFRQLYHWHVVIGKAAGVSCKQMNIMGDKSWISFCFGSHKN